MAAGGGAPAPILALREDRSGPSPEGAAHEPRNYAETVEDVRRVGANDPPGAPFPRPPPIPATDTRSTAAAGTRSAPAAGTRSTPGAVVVQLPYTSGLRVPMKGMLR